MIIVKLFAKLLVIPVLLIVRIIGTVFYGVAWLAAHAVGPLLFSFGGFAVYSAYLHKWTDAVILSVLCLLIYGVFAASGFLIGLIQLIGDGMVEFLFG